MRRRNVVLACLMAGLLIGAGGAVRTLRPNAAGVWYPAEPDALRKAVAKYLDEAPAPAVTGHVVACIVPHAPYETSGAVAASAFKLLKPGQYDRVIVLAPAHYSTFRGCSIPSVQLWRTPLGDILLDNPSIRALDRSSLIDVRAVRYDASGMPADRNPLHEREYTIEVVLPFLQARIGAFLLIPILVGDFLDYQNNTDENALAAVAKTIQGILDERTLLVVSSDFTHFGNTFSYRPFRDNILEGIESLDRTAFDWILKRDYDGFQTYLTDTRNPICGKCAISILLRLLPKGVKGTLLQYDVSARRTGDTRSSISFASIVFTTPDADAPPTKAEEGAKRGSQ